MTLRPFETEPRRRDPGETYSRLRVNVSRAVGVIAAVAICCGVIGRIASLQDPAGRAVAFRQESRHGRIAVKELLDNFHSDQAGRFASVDPLETVLASPFSEIPRTEILAASFERFDADAPVVLTPGADAAPGRRGFDDDFDGVVDNGSELGAFGSDDHCVTPVDPEFEKHLAMPGNRIIGRGAFIPTEFEAESADPVEVAETAFPGDATPGDAPEPSLRVVVTGKTRGRTWVWPVEL